MLELKGRWHIVQGPASYEEALDLTRGMPQGLLQVPSYWEGAITDSSGSPLPNNGDAYLVLELELSDERPELAIYVESAGSAHTLISTMIFSLAACRLAVSRSSRNKKFRGGGRLYCASRTILDAQRLFGYF